MLESLGESLGEKADYKDQKSKWKYDYDCNW